ncbi:MAG: DUF4097 domain-containing protein [Candidatus Aminicenantes bacterium]|nr:DUF4097 domain-containing protein [Candidatus Aminicenantes bacterium]
MNIKILAVLFFFAASTALFAAEETRQLSLDTDGIEMMVIECGAGDCRIEGVEGRDSIEVRARITVRGMSSRRSRQFIEEKVVLTLERNGSRAVLKSLFRPHISLFSVGSKMIDLTILVPSRLDLDIDDSSGDMDLKNIDGSVVIDDSSGDITVRNVRGNVDIDDNSGDIVLEAVGGSVMIDDRSGTIELRDLGGRVNVDDSSGDIFIQTAVGDVTVSDSSGDITIDGVERDVIIKSDGSGDVDITNVRGRIIKEPAFEN